MPQYIIKNIRGGYDALVIPPLFIITIFCFSFILLQPHKAVSSSPTESTATSSTLAPSQSPASSAASLQAAKPNSSPTLKTVSGVTKPAISSHKK